MDRQLEHIIFANVGIKAVVLKYLLQQNGNLEM